MYLHIGQNAVLRKKDIIGIFDLDTSTVAKATRDYLEKAEKSGKTKNIGDPYELPKTFIVCKENKKTNIYITQLSTLTLEKRAEQGIKDSI